MKPPKGPLHGTRIIEMAGIGPGPFAAMLLGDMGAEVIRIDRPVAAARSFEIDPTRDIVSRNRRSLAVDLKSAAGRDIVLRLCASAQVLIEGFRPQVMERLGLGPEPAMRANPALVYGRMTGWGQSGPWAQSAGHDINYIALSGALHGMGRAGEPPAPPLNLVGDYGAGAMLLVTGILAALLHARTTGEGQVVDAAILDGSALFMTAFMGLKAAGLWSDARASNLLDGGAYFYDCYATQDGAFLAVGALEPKFFAELLRIGALDPATFVQDEPERWPDLRAQLAQVIARKTRDEWSRLFEGSDACVAPVLSLTEAPAHPHNRARATFINAFGMQQPAPAPRFSATPGSVRSAPPDVGADTCSILAEIDFAPAEIERLLHGGVCMQAGSG